MDLVTETDKKVEDFIFSFLKEKYPSHRYSTCSRPSYIPTLIVHQALRLIFGIEPSSTVMGVKWPNVSEWRSMSLCDTHKCFICFC